MNKRFCDLVENDSIFINELGVNEKSKIVMIERNKDNILIDTEDELIVIDKKYFETDVLVCYEWHGNKTIATSMDKLLLECGDINV